jgi:hypothetical protein
MKIQTIDAQVWWIASADEIRPTDGLPPQWFEAVKTKFGFAQYELQKQQAQGLDFRSGSFGVGDRFISVPLLSVYNDGVSVAVQSHTRNAELVLQEVLTLFASMGVREPITPPIHYYVSTIVADLTSSIDHLFAPALLKNISAAMPIEGDARCLHFAFHFDPLTVPNRIAQVNPSNFRIERRTHVPYDQNRYFSQANTTTEKHVELLEQIDREASLRS